MNIFAEIGLHLSGLERLRTMMTEGRLTGIEQTLGLRIVEVEEGRVVVEGTPGPHVYNPFAVVHGGFAAAILDNACGYAAQYKMAPGQMCPLHKHRQASKQTAHHDAAPSGSAIRSSCAPVDPALIAFAFGLGILSEPISLNVIALSIPVPTEHAAAVHRSRSLDPPPPRA